MKNKYLGISQVTFLLMPVEIGWAATVQWIAGDMACRIFAFFRTFGLFLSSFVLVCISIDRCVSSNHSFTAGSHPFHTKQMRALSHNKSNIDIQWSSWIILANKSYKTKWGTWCRWLNQLHLIWIFIFLRCGAILQPLNLSNWKRRGRLMLAIAWSASCICSLPQVKLFPHHFHTLPLSY